MSETPTLTKWQEIRYTELWDARGIEVEITRNREGLISSFLSHADVEEDTFLHKSDTTDDLIAAGWKFVKPLKEEVVELIPSPTYFDVANEIVALAPEQLAGHKDLIQGLVKQYGHGEKHWVYSRFKLHFGKDLSEFWQNVLRLKIETHRNLARVSPIRLGQGKTTEQD